MPLGSKTTCPPPDSKLPRAFHPVRPRIYDNHIDTIELHVLDPRIVRSLPAGHSFDLEYLLLANRDADGFRWVDEEAAKARRVLDRFAHERDPPRE